MPADSIQTVKGTIPIKDLGLMLPHEHLFTDLRGPSMPDYAQADADNVVAVLSPNLSAAYDAGVRAFVECSTVGVGRNVSILKRLADATPIHLIAPTGVYRDAFVPASMRDLSAEALADRWVRDLTEGIDNTPIRAGFIKIAMSDDGPTPLEVRILEAAAQASKQTGAIIGSHTIGGAIARQEAAILESHGLELHRFIWIHAQTESDFAIHKELAKRGAYIEFDAIGSPGQSQTAMRDAVLALLDADCAEHILLSHDAGWYQPGQPNGVPEHGSIRGYRALTDEFLPMLSAAGVSNDLIHLLTVTNPARAFAFSTIS